MIHSKIVAWVCAREKTAVGARKPSALRGWVGCVLSETERFELALAMKHTPLATLKYIREFASRTDDFAANNELPKSY